MAPIYDNAEFIRKRSQLKDVTFVKWIKVLLLVLAVSLGFALGGICALSLLYAGKLSSCDSQQHNVSITPADPEQMLCISATEMDLLQKYHRLKGCLSSCTKFIGSSCKLCEEGWTAHGGKCYFFSSEKQTWFKSQNSCVALKANLVTINSSAVQDFLVSKIKETHWIGLNDQDTEGRWVWLNNQTLEETGLKFWYGTQPDDWNEHNIYGEDCACLGYERQFLNKWFDASCEYNKTFICEKEYSITFSDD